MSCTTPTKTQEKVHSFYVLPHTYSKIMWSSPDLYRPNICPVLAISYYILQIQTWISWNGRVNHDQYHPNQDHEQGTKFLCSSLYLIQKNVIKSLYVPAQYQSSSGHSILHSIVLNMMIMKWQSQPWPVAPNQDPEWARKFLCSTSNLLQNNLIKFLYVPTQYQSSSGHFILHSIVLNMIIMKWQCQPWPVAPQPRPGIRYKVSMFYLIPTPK
jgi:hypothetical protein